MKRLLKKIILAITILLCFSRILVIDQDTLPQNITSITQEDEGYYSITALNLYHIFDGRRDAFFPADIGGDTFLGLYTIPFTFPSLVLFGNNLVGLRLPSVLIGTGLIYILLISVRIFDKSFCRWLNPATLFFLLFLCSDFTLFNNSISVNPQIYSAFFNGTHFTFILLRVS